MELSSGQHRLQHISCIHGPVRLSGSYDGVQLVDKQDDISLTVFYFLQHCFQTLFKLSPVLCSGYQSTHIQGKKLLILQGIRDVSPDDPLCQSFNNCGLTYTRLTDQHRIILGLPGKNPDHVPDLFVTANDRIQLLLSGTLYQVLPVFI